LFWVYSISGFGKICTFQSIFDYIKKNIEWSLQREHQCKRHKLQSKWTYVYEHHMLLNVERHLNCGGREVKGLVEDGAFGRKSAEKQILLSPVLYCSNIISNCFPIKWKKWFFLLAPFFWKIKQFLLATDCSNCSKHYSKKTIPYDERKKQKTKKYFFIIFMIFLFLIIEQFIIAIVLVPNIVPKG